MAKDFVQPEEDIPPEIHLKVKTTMKIIQLVEILIMKMMSFDLLLLINRRRSTLNSDSEDNSEPENSNYYSGIMDIPDIPEYARMNTSNNNHNRRDDDDDLSLIHI